MKLYATTSTLIVDIIKQSWKLQINISDFGYFTEKAVKYCKMLVWEVHYELLSTNLDQMISQDLVSDIISFLCRH